MGIKDLPWEAILGVIFFISAIITILTNLKFVSNCLGFIGNFLSKIFRFLTNSIIRKVRMIPRFERIVEKEDWQFDWNLKHKFVLEKFDDRTRSYNSLYKLYKKEFSDASKLEFKVIIEDLEEADLIRFSYKIFRKKYYKTTRKGRYFALKGLLAEMERRKIASKF